MEPIWIVPRNNIFLLSVVPPSLSKIVELKNVILSEFINGSLNAIFLYLGIPLTCIGLNGISIIQ